MATDIGHCADLASLPDGHLLWGRAQSTGLQHSALSWTRVERRMRTNRDREMMTEDLCEHDMVPAYCAFCRPLPVGVVPRGFRTKGGNAYHNDDRCDWLRKGQRFAERKGREVHDIEPVAWHSVAPGQLARCEACCTPEWIERHQRAPGEAGIHHRLQFPHQRIRNDDRVGIERVEETPSSPQDIAQPVWVNLDKLFGSSTSSSVAGGLVLEDVHGDLLRWTRSANGKWIGIVTWVGRTAEGSEVTAFDQWVPADALRPRS